MNAIASGTAPSSGLDGVGDKNKIIKMRFCLKEAMSDRDRDTIREAVLCSHRRDERDGRLLIQCCAINDNLERRCFFLNVQRGFGTGGSSITEATQKAWEELCTPAHGAPRCKSPAGRVIDKSLFDHARSIHHQLVVDAASDEQASGRQMREARCTCNSTTRRARFFTYIF